MNTSLRKFSSLVIAFFLINIVIGQQTETRNLSAFEGISVSAGIKAELVKGNTNSIDITASGIELDKVSTEIKGDMLHVGIDQSWWKSFGSGRKRKVEVVITYSASMNALSASSGSSMKADHTILSKNLDLEVSSGASINLEIDANKVSVDLSSGSTIVLAGRSQDIEIDMSSGSSLDAYDLIGEHVKIDGSSGSSARVHATESLNADISSGSSVKYKGNPSNTDFDKSSGARISKANS